MAIETKKTVIASPTTINCIERLGRSENRKNWGNRSRVGVIDTHLLCCCAFN
jgi:hypothetical protein